MSDPDAVCFHDWLCRCCGVAIGANNPTRCKHPTKRDEGVVHCPRCPGDINNPMLPGPCPGVSHADCVPWADFDRLTKLALECQIKDAKKDAEQARAEIVARLRAAANTHELDTIGHQVLRNAADAIEREGRDA